MLAYFLILVLLVIVIWVYKENQFDRFTIEDKIFQIEKYSPSKHDSLTTLVKVRKSLDRLVSHLKTKYPENYYVNRLEKRFDQTVLRENNPDQNSDDTSYTINKGDTLVLCLRTKDGNLVDLNTLTYVAIHELAHIFSSSYHHNNEFWRNMRFLIDEAINIGVYVQTDYEKNPVRYCGLTISSDVPNIPHLAQKQQGIQGQQNGGSIKANKLAYVLSKSSIKSGIFSSFS